MRSPRPAAKISAFMARPAPHRGMGKRLGRTSGLRWDEAFGAQGKLPASVFDGIDDVRTRSEAPAGPAVRRLRHPPVAAVARGLSQAVPAAGRRGHHAAGHLAAGRGSSVEQTSELPSLMGITYADFCLK